MSDIVEALQKKRDRLEELDAKYSEKKGERKAVLARLKSDFGVSGVKEARKRSKELEKKITELRSRRDKVAEKIDKLMESVE